MKARTLLFAVVAFVLMMLNPTSEGLGLMSGQVTGQSQEYITATIKGREAKQDELLSGRPEDVRDSLGQWIPNVLSSSVSSDLREDQIQEKRDSKGRVARIVWSLDDQVSLEYSYSYDEQGRFSTFFYRTIHKNRPLSYGITTEFQGKFTYHENGSRECEEIIQSEDIWICGTFYYDIDGKWMRMEGRNLYPGYGIGDPIDVRACYYEGAFVGESRYINGVEAGESFYFNWCPHTPETEQRNLSDW